MLFDLDQRRYRRTTLPFTHHLLEQRLCAAERFFRAPDHVAHRTFIIDKPKHLLIAWVGEFSFSQLRGVTYARDIFASRFPVPGFPPFCSRSPGFRFPVPCSRFPAF